MQTAMQKPLRTYLRVRRRESGLSQCDLAVLIGTHRNVISDHEREIYPLSARLLIAAALVFGITGDELFPGFHHEIESDVCQAALALYQSLEGKMDARSLKKRKLLGGIPKRVKPLEV